MSAPGKKLTSFDRAGIAVLRTPHGMLPVWFWFINATVSGLRMRVPFEAAAVQQHLQEHRVVAGRRVERAARRPELALDRDRLQRLQRERAVGLARVQPRLARTLFLARDVAAVLHAERAEDPLAEIILERLAADRLDDAARPLDVDAV